MRQGAGGERVGERGLSIRFRSAHVRHMQVTYLKQVLAVIRERASHYLSVGGLVTSRVRLDGEETQFWHEANTDKPKARDARDSWAFRARRVSLPNVHRLTFLASDR